MRHITATCFFILCFALYAASQTNNHHLLSIFGTRNGLLSPKIYSIKQTSDRYLWIGTEIGASRYNGYEFQSIQYTTAQEQIGKIVTIAEDSNGGIWLGGEAGLFYFFNGETTRCVFVKNYTAAIEALVVDGDGNLWIGEMHGLYRLTRQEIVQWQATKKNLLLKPFNNISDRVICVDTDAKDNIYFGSFDGVFFLGKNAGKAILKWKNSNPYNLVHFVTALSPDSIFINQYDGESVSLINNIEKHYNEKTSVGQRFFKKDDKIFRLTTSAVEDLHANTFVPLIVFGQKTNFAYDALCDAEGNFWVGTWEGLFRYRYTPFTIYHRQEKDHPETFSFLENRNGEALFGGNRGRVDYKKENEIVTYPNLKPVFPLSEVLAMYQHDDGSYWFGSGYEGVTQLRNGIYTNYDESIGLADNHCNTFYCVDEHTLFGCTEKGILVIDPTSDKPIKAQYGFAKAYNRQPKLLGVFQLAKNEFLFYSNSGLFRLHNGVLQNETIKGLAAENIYVTRITSDKKGRIWMSTQGKGLLQCSFKNDELTLQQQYTKKNGLLSDELLSVLVDKNGKLWIADYTSLSLLNEDAFNSYFINFTEKDGLPGDYYQHLHLAQQKDGTIWAITSMNIFSFHPDSLQLNLIEPKLFFNSIELEKQKDQRLATSNDVRLSYDQNSLSFSFTAISLTNPDAIKYAYRLLPGDTSWIETHERKLYFTSLKPGKYKLEVEASNNAGVWSAPLQYSFEIRPPFWNTWWFYSLLSVLFLLVMYALFKRRIKSVRDKAALKQQLTALESKALRAQMNPHFIFNSLNAIQELIVTENVTAAYDYLSKFSKLLRLVLNNSEKSLIPLSDEIQMLQLYLELESLRFRQNFIYDIDVEKSLDTDGILIPPLLLQPFIENAVWHGLMLKEGEKKLKLFIRQNKADEIVCVFEDNGIGRKRSAEIKSQKLGAKYFESKGLKLSRHRIELIDGVNKKGRIEIDDLYEGEIAIGTKVSVYLPLIHN